MGGVTIQYIYLSWKAFVVYLLYKQQITENEENLFFFFFFFFFFWGGGGGGDAQVSVVTFISIGAYIDIDKNFSFFSLNMDMNICVFAQYMHIMSY